VRWRDKSIGYEVNWRNGVISLSLICGAAGLAINPACAQARVGEAVVIKNEVVRIANGWVDDLFLDGTLGPQPVGNTIHGGVGLRVNY
jgi:hypothetical protein